MSSTHLRLTFKWWLLASLVGILSGTASALFLLSLDLVTQARESRPWLLFFLPWAGLIIVFFYSRYGQKVESGNNLILEQIHNPQEIIPLRMWPLVWGGTLLTHLGGGSAGREGTAVQMGASISDQFTKMFRLSLEERKILLMTGIAGGFASVFGTPLAGTIFGIEVLALRRLQYRGLLPCLWSAFVAHIICLLWGVQHTPYQVSLLPEASLRTLLLAVLAGIFFGLCALSFSWTHGHLGSWLKRVFPNAYGRVFCGGLIIIAGTWLVGSPRFLGLGIPVILESFQHVAPASDFFLKAVFTLMTLSVGFKGGEVTPLFFIGATLGSSLSAWLDLPTGLLAAMGFVAVFAGAANTPLACILMAFELFGPTVSFYAAIAIITSYLCSGNRGIYHSQKIEAGKYAKKN